MAAMGVAAAELELALLLLDNAFFTLAVAVVGMIVTVPVLTILVLLVVGMEANIIHPLQTQT
jgi:hypothetical protein